MTNVLDDLFENIDVAEPSEEGSNETVTSDNSVNEPTTEQVNETPTETVEPKPVEVKPEIDIEKEVQRVIAAREKEASDRKEYEAKLKAKEEEDLKNIPDPIADIDGWRKYQLEREQRIQSNFDNKLKAEQELIRSQQAINNLSSTIEKTRSNAETTYSKDIVDKAERWAADLIKENPQYLEYLVKNPSLEYVTKEYMKVQDRIAFENDPTTFIMNKYAEINNGKAPVNTPKKPPTSINKVSSTSDPEPELPEYLQGLF